MKPLLRKHNDGFGLNGLTKFVLFEMKYNLIYLKTRQKHFLLSLIYLLLCTFENGAVIIE